MGRFDIINPKPPPTSWREATFKGYEAVCWRCKQHTVGELRQDDEAVLFAVTVDGREDLGVVPRLSEVHAWGLTVHTKHDHQRAGGRHRSKQVQVTPEGKMGQWHPRVPPPVVIECSNPKCGAWNYVTEHGINAYFGLLPAH